MIQVFKFGGASVRDADAVRNVAGILGSYTGQKTIVVVSAMGKTTNALEVVHRQRFMREDYLPALDAIIEFHKTIAEQLSGERKPSSQLLHQFVAELKKTLLNPCSDDFDREYDQVVGYGELLSTAIISDFLIDQGYACSFLDARDIVRTDSRFRDARVDWQYSGEQTARIQALFRNQDFIIVQGFIGSDSHGRMTTLGREGSDFTASIMAYLTDAKSVTIWKDVPGMLNADPKWFKDTVQLARISFREAIELAYYGASVIHPKTIKPLQNKGIPLYIKSFVDPSLEGTVIQESMEFDHLVPSFILKKNVLLISISTQDFSFVVEDNLSEIFDVLSELGIRVHLMENSAISFSICTDMDEYKRDLLFSRLRPKYQIRYNEGLTLLTVRHYTEETLQQLIKSRDILLEQRSRNTVRFVVRDTDTPK